MQDYLNQFTPNELQALFFVALGVLFLTGLGLYSLLKKEN